MIIKTSRRIELGDLWSLDMIDEERRRRKVDSRVLDARQIGAPQNFRLDFAGYRLLSKSFNRKSGQKSG